MSSKLTLKKYTIDPIAQEEVASLEDMENARCTTQHSLFVTEVEGVQHFKLHLEDIMPEKAAFHVILNRLSQAQQGDTLELRIHSNGGSTDIGQIIINMINNVFPGRATAVLDNMGKSMGAIIFCNCPKRIVNVNSDIMFHWYSVGVSGKGNEVTSSIDRANEALRDLYQRSMVDTGFLTQEEVDRLYDGKDYPFGTVEMCQRGIATHVLVRGIEIPAVQYLGYKSESLTDDDMVISYHSERNI